LDKIKQFNFGLLLKNGYTAEKVLFFSLKTEDTSTSLFSISHVIAKNGAAEKT